MLEAKKLGLCLEIIRRQTIESIREFFPDADTDECIQLRYKVIMVENTWDDNQALVVSEVYPDRLTYGDRAGTWDEEMDFAATNTDTLIAVLMELEINHKNEKRKAKNALSNRTITA